MAQTADTLVLFGATGDLTQRMLLPSLFSLHTDHLLPPKLAILGAARSDMGNDGFRSLAEAALAKYLPADRRLSGASTDFLKRLHYVALDAAQPESFGALSKALRNGRTQTLAILLSTGPSLFQPAIAGLQSAGLTGDKARIGLEKPLGHDLASFHDINDAVASALSRGADVPHRPLSRQGNGTEFAGASLWQQAVRATVERELASNISRSPSPKRWASRGAAASTMKQARLRDMVQNHMLQLLALVAMEPPAHFNATEVRDEKVKVLRSLRPIDRATAATHSVIGQYGAGVVRGASVPGYVEELGKPSGTETFVALKTYIDNWRWKGVPFYLRTGKRLAESPVRNLHPARHVPHSIFESGGASVQPNKLIIRLQPEENIRLLVMAKEPGLDRDGIRLREVPLDLSLTNAFAGVRRRIAYERLLLDFIEGDPDPVRASRRGRGAMEMDRCDTRWLGIGPDAPAGLRGGNLGATGRQCADQARRSELA